MIYSVWKNPDVHFDRLKIFLSILFLQRICHQTLRKQVWRKCSVFVLLFIVIWWLVHDSLSCLFQCSFPAFFLSLVPLISHYWCIEIMWILSPYTILTSCKKIRKVAKVGFSQNWKNLVEVHFMSFWQKILKARFLQNLHQFEVFILM